MCEQCNDTGRLDDKMCPCEVSRLLTKRVGKMFADCRLNSKPQTKCQYVALHEMSKNPEQGYFIFGEWGTGKTWLLSCLHNSLWLKYHSKIKYFTDNAILKLTHYQNENQLEDFIRDINQFNVRAIFIDDICRTHYKDYNQDGLYEIINNAYLAGVPLVITSNYTTEAIAKITDGAIARRIEHNSTIIKLTEVYEQNRSGLLCVPKVSQ